VKDVAHWVEGDRLKITQYTQAMFQLKYPVERINIRQTNILPTGERASDRPNER
jgi:hypothetical protein